MLMLDPLLLRVVIGTLLLCARLLIDYTEERKKIGEAPMACFFEAGSAAIAVGQSFLASPTNSTVTDGAISNFHCNEHR